MFRKSVDKSEWDKSKDVLYIYTKYIYINCIPRFVYYTQKAWKFFFNILKIYKNACKFKQSVTRRSINFAFFCGFLQHGPSRFVDFQGLKTRPQIDFCPIFVPFLGFSKLNDPLLLIKRNAIGFYRFRINFWFVLKIIQIL